MIRSEAEQVQFIAQSMCGVIPRPSRKGISKLRSRLLNSKHSSYDVRDGLERTTLHFSATRGDARITSYLIACGCEVDAKDFNGKTPLMLAASVSQDIPTIEALLKAKANIYTSDLDGASALKMIIDRSRKWLNTLTPELKHLIILLQFFEQVRQDFTIDPELTVRRLQKAGCPMALVPFMNCTEKVMRYLRQNDITLDERVGSLTALHVAVLRQDIESVKALIKYRADLNAVDQHRQTALFAIDLTTPDTLEKVRILRVLLRHGASLSIARSDGLTPMEYFLKNGHEISVEIMLESQPIAPILFNRHGPDGHTILYFLVRNRNLNHSEKLLSQVITFLRDRGFDVNMLNNKGVSVLTLAIAEGDRWIAEVLMRNGAKANLIEILENTQLIRIFRRETGYEYYYEWVVELIFMQRGINIHQLSSQMNGESSRGIGKPFLAKIVIAHLAIIAATGGTIPDTIIERINSDAVLKEHYRVCNERIEEMKSTKVYGSMTLYQLLIKSQSRIEVYVSNPDFVSAFRGLTSQNGYQKVYYIVVLRNRVETAIKTNAMRKKAARIISEITILRTHGISDNHYIVDKIVGHLNAQDLKNIIDIRRPPQEILSVSCANLPKVQRNFVSEVIRKFFART